MMQVPLSEMTDAALAELAGRPAGHPDYNASLSLGAREELALRAAMAAAARPLLALRSQG